MSKNLTENTTYPKIIPVNFGNTVLPESMIFPGGSADIIQPIVLRVFLVKTENKLILVDAGCVTMPGFNVTEFIGPINALKKINIQPEDITDVIITHSHHDHIECVSEFTKAVIHIQKDEYECGKKYLTPDLKVNIFDEYYNVTPNVKVIKIGGHSIGSCIVEIAAENKPCIITGDECYKRACIDMKIPTGSTSSPEKSLAFIEKYANGNYTVLLSHDN